MANIVQADDSLIIDRDRGIRAIVFFGTPVALAFFGGLLGAFLANTFIGMKGVGTIGFIVGAAGGLIGFLSIKHLFVVVNEVTGMLVTINQLQTLFGKDKKKSFVVYGPGTHLALPWETRAAENNIPVDETSEVFTFKAICKDGTLTGKGSFRLRPDFQNPINYLSGVGAVAGELKDLIIAFINQWLAQKTMQKALDEQHLLHQAVHDKFVDASTKTPFEERFGVQLGDITTSELLMSDEAQRTRAGLNEAEMVAKGTAILLGYSDVAEIKVALAANAITQDDIDRARRDFRIISGNMEGATVNRYEVDIKGLSPEVATALTSFFQSPAARALTGKSVNNQSKKGTSSK